MAPRQFIDSERCLQAGFESCIEIEDRAGGGMVPGSQMVGLEYIYSLEREP